MCKRIRQRVCQKAPIMIATANLIRHPATDRDPIRRIAVEMSRMHDAVTLSFRLEGELSGIRIPAAGPAQRADNLWRHCCFEAFLQVERSEGYLEFNFSPSGAWAAYRFAGRRSGRESPELMAPRMEVRRGPDWLAMNIELSLAGIAEFTGSPRILAGLAAVIEDAQRGLSYWALAHGADQPDFHDPATFTLRLPAA